MNEPRYDAGLDRSQKVSIPNELHAHHTGWCLEPESGAYVMTLEREDNSIIAVAVYTWEDWQDVFDRLKAARFSRVLPDITDEGDDKDV